MLICLPLSDWRVGAIPDFRCGGIRGKGAVMRGTHAVWPILLLCSRLAVAGPYPPNVTINWDDEIKFGKYHSYIWVPGHTPPPGVNAADYDRVHSSIDRYLASRGFKKGPTGEFAISFHAVGATEGYEGSYRPGWGSVATLSIDIYDTATKKPIWNGAGRVEVSRRLSQGELDRAVARLLERFPPSHGCSHSPADTLIHPCPRD